MEQPTIERVRRSLGAAGEPVPSRTIRTLTIVALTIVAALNVADVLTTHIVLQRSGVEANPLAGVLLSSGTLLWVKLVLVALALLIALRIRPRMGVLVLAWFVAGLYATAVLSNLLIIRLT